MSNQQNDSKRMTVRMAVILSGLVAFTAWTGCDKVCGVEGSGNLDTETRNVSSFDRIQVNGKMNVYVHQDDESKVVITTDDNIMHYVESYVSGSQLYLDLDHKWCGYDATQMEIHVYTNDVSYIKTNGECDVNTIDTLHVSSFTGDVNGQGNLDVLVDCGDLNLKMDGDADIFCNGSATHATYTINGHGKVDALGTLTQHVDANINGSGKIYLSCSDGLDATIDGSGHIYYSGDCTVTTHINGSGSVEPY